MKSLLNCRCGDKLMPLAPFILRVVTGLIFAMHGWQKLQSGVPQTAGFLGMLGFPIPEVMAVLLIAAELGGGILLILGLFTHWAAKLLAFVSLVALVSVHITKGFFVGAGGFEFILLLLAASVAIMITGPGRWSIDRRLSKAT